MSYRKRGTNSITGNDATYSTACFSRKISNTFSSGQGTCPVLILILLVTWLVPVTPSYGVDMDSRQALLSNLMGFGASTTGGLHGADAVVTNLNDSGPGSLRSFAESDDDLWISFAVSGTITLDSDIRIKQNKTIDGRGKDITLTDEIYMENPIAGPYPVGNIIIHNLSITGNSHKIRLARGVEKVWLDHLFLTGDGYNAVAIAVSEGSTDVTISWCHIKEMTFAMLFGGGTNVYGGDEVMRITIHHTFMDNNSQRNPRLRFGKVHMFNNLMLDWDGYGAVSSMRGQTYSDRNIYDSTKNDKALWATAFASDPETGSISSHDDLFLSKARIVDGNPGGKVFNPADYYAWNSETADDNLRAKIIRFAGPTNESTPDSKPPASPRNLLISRLKNEG